MTQQLTLFAILDDMLAYQAEQFDAEPVEFEVYDGANKRTMGPFDDRETAQATADLHAGAEVIQVQGELNVSGADLVDAFTAWRDQLKDARPLLDELVDGLRSARDQFLVYEAHHRAKAGEDGRDEKAKTNADIAARLGKLIDRAGGSPPAPRTVYITVTGGSISDVMSPDDMTGVTFTTIDYDTDGIERERSSIVSERPGHKEVAYIRPGQEIARRPAPKIEDAADAAFDPWFGDE